LVKNPTRFRLALELYQWQSISALLLALLLLLLKRSAGIAFTLGAVVLLIGNGFLTWRVYQKHKRLEAIPMLTGFLGGEFGKYAIIVVLTVLLAKYATISWLFYLLGLVLPQLLGVLIYALVTRMKN